MDGQNDLMNRTQAVAGQSAPSSVQAGDDLASRTQAVAQNGGSTATEQPGKLRQWWNWTLGSFGPDADKYQDKGIVENILFGDLPPEQRKQGVVEGLQHSLEQKTGDINKAAEREAAATGKAPGVGTQLESFATGSAADAVKLARSMATPKNAGIATAATFAPPLRLPIAAYFAVHGAIDALTPKQEDETDADAVQRRLLGAATLFGGVAGTGESAREFGKFTKKVGDSLIDYAPKIGKIGSRKLVSTAVGAAVHGIPGAVIGDVAATEFGPQIASATTKLSQLTGHATNLVGDGMIWMGNLMKADMLGRQPLPLTKASLANVKDTELEAVVEKSLKDATESESEHISKADKDPMSLVFLKDKPYFEAAQKELGNNAPVGDVAALARKLKSQDEYLSAVIQRNSSPRIMHGESTLTRVLTAQSNANLIKVAKSRGIDVTKEIQLKEKVANPILVKKIINDMGPEELQEIGDRNLENSRFSHQFGSIGQEAANTLGLQEYFPNVKIPKTVQARTAKAVAGEQ